MGKLTIFRRYVGFMQFFDDKSGQVQIFWAQNFQARFLLWGQRGFDTKLNDFPLLLKITNDSPAKRVFWLKIHELYGEINTR